VKLEKDGVDGSGRRDLSGHKQEKIRENALRIPRSGRPKGVLQTIGEKREAKSHE